MIDPSQMKLELSRFYYCILHSIDDKLIMDNSLWPNNLSPVVVRFLRAFILSGNKETSF
jgi:hypothetical protein